MPKEHPKHPSYELGLGKTTADLNPQEFYTGVSVQLEMAFYLSPITPT
ncbi:hypothetical protein [Helicobacter bizzozeronii]|nr:hypothetical protein [Helicobacter bizzozeronii]